MLVVYEGDDITIQVQVDGRGFLHVLSHASDGRVVRLPKLAPPEALALAKMLVEKAEEAGK